LVETALQEIEGEFCPSYQIVHIHKLINQTYVHLFKELKSFITLINLLLDVSLTYLAFMDFTFLAMILFIFLVRNDYEKSILSNFSFLVMVSNLFPLISQICQT
jgi:hypothetical protein